jgi:hypothetical protein
VLLNDGNGHFTADPLWEETQLGMVTDAIWFEDGKELVVAGEWMPLTLFQRDQSGWQKKEIEGSSGLWRCLVATDGEPGFWAGNWGGNSAFGDVSSEHPLKLYLNDVDGNGRVDPLITQVQNGKEYLFADKGEISAQIPGWRRNNLSYQDFAARTFQENFPDVEFSEPLEVKTLGSHFYWLKNGIDQWVYDRTISEITCTNDILPLERGKLVAGNQSTSLPRLGRQDAAALELISDIDGYGRVEQLIPWAGGNSGIAQKLLQTKDGLIIVIGRKEQKPE